MGNCTSVTKKKKGDSALDDNKQPVEDVTYASIDHTTSKGPRGNTNTIDDDCDYATVNLPAAPESDTSSKEECADDYVLMG